MSKLIKIDTEYKQWFAEIKEHIRKSQIKAALSVNREMLSMYYDLGKRILSIKADTRWGSGFYQNLSTDLRVEFPDMQGFSETNLRYIVKFYRFYSDTSSIPWGHQKFLLDKCKSVEEALFYIQKCRENGWSRNLLMNFFESNLFGREGKAITNFSLQLPGIQSDLAQQTLKDPYNFDFLSMRQGYNERELEDALTTNITKFLIELRSGFSYIGPTKDSGWEE